MSGTGEGREDEMPPMEKEPGQEKGEFVAKSLRR